MWAFFVYSFICVAVFAMAYLINITYITVFYHRAYAHDAIVLQPRFKKFVENTASFFTGLDLLSWVVMHRRHHRFADTAKDPHSPKNVGIWGVLLEQKRSYSVTTEALLRCDADYMEFTYGLEDLRVDWFNRTKIFGIGIWLTPYIIHALFGLALSVATEIWPLGFFYLLGIMGHPIQGWAVNAFGHHSGGRNFDTNDASTNCRPVMYGVAGEGLQNNHHRYPASARFSYRRNERDWGYAIALWIERRGWLRIRRETLMPREP